MNEEIDFTLTKEEAEKKEENKEYWEKFQKEKPKEFEEMKKVWEELPIIEVKKNPMSILTNEKIQEEEFKKAQPYFYDKSGLWWLWDSKETKWERVDETDILIMIEESTGTDTISPGKKSKILNLLKQNGRKNVPKEIRKTWVQFKRTIVDIETGDEIKATPEYFVTNPIPWELDKDKFTNTPKMDEIFEQWVGKDYVKTLYEIIAYSLLPDYPIHRIFCFMGEGLNGKSKYLELLRKFVGKNNCSSTELDTLLSSRFEITRLHKKLVCQMGETNFNEMSKTSILKKLSGGDLIGFEYKGKDPFEENNYSKILIATNNLPTTTDKTIGFYRRWLIIDFPNQFSEKKDILGDIPEEEYNCLAVKCVGILKDLLVDRSFHKEGSIEQRKEKYESKSNFLEKFIELFIENDSMEYITLADFSKRFKAWSKENRHRELSDISISKAMKKIGFTGEKKYFSWLFDGKGGQLRVFEGLKWKD